MIATEEKAPGRDGTAPEANNLERAQPIVSNGRSQGLIDVYDHAEAPQAKATTTLCDLIESIRSGEFKERVRAIRDIAVPGCADAQWDTDKIKALKARLGPLKKALTAVSISGACNGRRKAAVAEGRFVHSGFLQIDIDHSDNPDLDLDEIHDLLIADPRVVAAFTSPSGTGMKGIARIPADPALHLRSFLAVEKHFADLGVRIDRACKDPVRLMFMTYDPRAWSDFTRTAEFEPLPEPPPAPTPSKPATALSGGKDSIVLRDGGGTREWTLDDLREMISVIPRPDYQTWLEICSGAWSEFGEDATPILMERWPEEQVGEYARKFADRLTEISLGTVVHHAKQQGWRPRPRERRSFAIRSHSKPGADKVEVATLDLWSGLGTADADAAIRIAMVANGRVHHIHQTEQWIIWNGCRWQPDHDGGMVRLAIEVANLAFHQAIELGGDRGKDALKAASAGRNRQKIVNALALLKAVDGITVSASNLDADPMLLGTPKGVIDLRQGCAIQPDPAMMISKSIAVDPDPDATCPTWLRFIDRITAGDRELADFLQVWAGYSLTGSTQEEALAFAYGSGANGKSTFIETLRHLLGDYAVSLPPEALMIDRNAGRGATPEIARLAGARLAVAVETEEGSQLAESRIKAITSHDMITARPLFSQPFEFVPTHKLFISGNHRPRITGTDHGVWRRLRLVPFIVSIPPEERDPHLREKLQAEQVGILNWMIEGCLRWQREGLRTPQSVVAATAEYKAAEDVIGQFLAERTVQDPDGRVLQSTLFQAYRQWADEQGIKRQLTANTLNRRLEDRGFARCRIKGGRFWSGVEMVEY